MKRKKIEYISLASVISALAVVFLHVNNTFWTVSPTERTWISANIIESVFYFAVPVFFMISGATLIDYSKRYSTKTYFKKRAKRTLLPYFLWSFIGLAFQVFYLRSIDPNVISWHYLVNGLANGNLVGIYWFFIPLFFIYLVIPLFAMIKDEKKKSVFIYIIGVLFIFNILLPFINSVFHLNLTGPLFTQESALVGNLFFVLVGYLINSYHINKKTRIFIYVLGLCGLLLMLLGTYYSSVSAGKVVNLYKGDTYTNIPCVFYAVSIFTLLKYVGERIMSLDVIKKVVNFFSPYTFTVYLAHWFVLQIIIKETDFNENALWFRLVMPIFIFVIISLATMLFVRVKSFLLNKIA